MRGKRGTDREEVRLRPRHRRLLIQGRRCSLERPGVVGLGDIPKQRPLLDVSDVRK